jgi:hypothetical protein
MIVVLAEIAGIVSQRPLSTQSFDGFVFRARRHRRGAKASGPARSIALSGERDAAGGWPA